MNQTCQLSPTGALKGSQAPDCNGLKEAEKALLTFQTGCTGLLQGKEFFGLTKTSVLIARPFQPISSHFQADI